ncbi:SRPBCC family protein [Streptomyces mangrovisoli]|uniref:Toxin n=1 Tax=Streptomyces mangrovisoli TaxID=1428628 RepID=A0A1J4P3U6_9ACTN|nr:SRPBCC family protein [Streptomyces mangrovisoli]OIJ68890.1 toxin [Streptomyces mangrovisoli]
MSADLTGTYLTLDDGRGAVRFSRVYDHPVDRVWTFVTDPDELVHWFPSRAEFELRPGGTVRFSGDPHMPDTTSRVLAVDPPRHLSFAWGDDELRFDLEDLGGGRTRLTLTDVLDTRDAAARNAAGWEVCLTGLDALARGERTGGPHTGSAAPWKEFYDRYTEAGTPSGAPVPGDG